MRNWISSPSKYPNWPREQMICNYFRPDLINMLLFWKSVHEVRVIWPGGVSDWSELMLYCSILNGCSIRWRLLWSFMAKKGRYLCTIVRASHFVISVKGILLPPANGKLREGNVFTGVCHSVHKGVCLLAGGLPLGGVVCLLVGDLPSGGTCLMGVCHGGGGGCLHQGRPP